MAETWSDLRALLDSGVAVESALGLADGVPVSQEDTSVCIISGQRDERFKYKLPSADDIDVLGLVEIKESLTVFPPFLDLSQLLQPLYIPESETESSSLEGSYLELPTPDEAPRQEGELLPDSVATPNPAHSETRNSDHRKRSREESSPQMTHCKKSRDQTSSLEVLDLSNDSSVDVL